MKSAVKGIVQLFAGYVIGGVVGYFAILLMSDNAHDRIVEAAMTGAFVTGPILAIAALIVIIYKSARRHC